MSIIKHARRLRYEIRNRLALSKTISAIQEKGGYSDKKLRFVNLGTFEFGNNLVIRNEGIDCITYSHITIAKHGHLKIGNNVGMSQVGITCKYHIDIGNDVKIGAGTLIFDTDFHNKDYIVRRDEQKDIETAKCSEVVIGNDCFIGTRVIIGKGVHIGDRTIIGAGSVVAKDIPSDCIAGGNPCKVIRFL